MVITSRKILFAATALVALAFSANAMFAQTRAGEGSDAASLVSPKYGTWGFDASGMDPSVKPGDDFFRYANGKWADRTQIPSDRTRYGYFDTLAELSENRMHGAVPSGLLADQRRRPADHDQLSLHSRQRAAADQS